MYFVSLQLQNFRNWQSLDLTFNQGFVVLSGPNSAGKTNILEALYFGGALRKFPESRTRQLFYTGADFFRVKLEAKTPEPLLEELQLLRQDTKYLLRLKLNSQETTRRKYASKVPLISFLPQDLGLLTHSPAQRRRFLDEALSAASVSYRHAHQQYARTLQQRNELWRKIVIGAAGLVELEIWDEALADFGAQICAAREGFFEYLNQNFGRVATPLSPELGRIKFVYHQSGLSAKPQYLEQLRALRKQERERGTTVYGPHRDDFVALWREEPVSGFVSRGQMRSITLGLKFLEKEYLEQHLGMGPIMLLDDVFSELDEGHQHQLVSFLGGLEQVFLTTAHLEEVQSYLPGLAQIHRLEGGIVNSKERV